MRIREEGTFPLTQTLVLLLPLDGVGNLVGHPGQLGRGVFQAGYGLLGGLAWKRETRQLRVTFQAFIH